MKKAFSLVLVLALLCSMMSLFAIAASEEAVTKDITSTLAAGCGTIGAYDSATNSVTLGADAAGDNYATTGTYIPAGTKATVSVNMKFNGFRDGMGGGLFFDPRANQADRVGVGGGTGVMTWSGNGYAQFKTWSWNTDFTPAAGDSWQDAATVLNTADPSVVYNMTVEFAADNTVKVTFTNLSTNASFVFMDGPVAFTNNLGVYVGCIMLHGSVTFSDMKVTTYKPIYGDTFYPVVGTWTYDEGTATLTGGTDGVGDNYAGTTKYFVDAGQRATVSVDVKFDAFGNGCGAGLFFDPLSKDDRVGVGGGMGVLTWSGDGFSQFKTWSWNPSKIATMNGDGVAADFWNPVENFAHNDTATVYTVKVEFYENGTATFSIINKTTGVEHVLDNNALTLTNTDGVYVGVMALNCKASFTNLTVDYPEANPDTADTIVPMLFLGISLAAVVVIVAKKNRH